MGTTISGTIVFTTLEEASYNPEPPVDVYATREERIMMLNYVNYIKRIYEP